MERRGGRGGGGGGERKGRERRRKAKAKAKAKWEERRGANVQSFSQSHLSATISRMLPLRAAIVMQLESKPGPMAAERRCSVGVVSMRISAFARGAAAPRALRRLVNELGASDTVGEHTVVDEDDDDDDDESGEGGFAFEEVEVEA